MNFWKTFSFHVKKRGARDLNADYPKISLERVIYSDADTILHVLPSCRQQVNV